MAVRGRAVHKDHTIYPVYYWVISHWLFFS